MKNSLIPGIKFFPDETIEIEFRGFKTDDAISAKNFIKMRKIADELLYPIGKLQKFSKFTCTSYDLQDIINRNPLWSFEISEKKTTYHLMRTS